MDAATQEILLGALPQRVGHLESAVGEIHKEQAAQAISLANVSSNLDSLARVVGRIDVKLDEQRTKKTDVGALASWAGVILMITALLFAGFSWRMTLHENQIERLSHRLDQTLTPREVERLYDGIDRLAAKERGETE